jgi:hypothetical protein
MMKGKKKKKKLLTNNISKLGEKECQYCNKSNIEKMKCFWNLNNLENKLKEK